MKILSLLFHFTSGFGDSTRVLLLKPKIVQQILSQGHKMGIKMRHQQSFFFFVAISALCGGSWRETGKAGGGMQQRAQAGIEPEPLQ